MPSLQSCLLALSAATLLSAKEVQRRADTTSSCPWVDVNNVNNGATTAGCCVGGTIAPVFLSVCDGWPICQGPTTTTTTSEPLSCATFINYSDSNYNSALSAASKSIDASGTTYCTTLGVKGSGCKAAASATKTTAAPASSATGSGGSAATATGDSDSSSSSSSSSSASSSKSAAGTTTSTTATTASTSSSSTASASTAAANALGTAGWGAWAVGVAAAGPGVVAALL